MTRFSQAALVGLAFLALMGCGPAPETAAPPSAADSTPSRESLNRIVDRYWDEHASLANPLSAQFVADSLAVERRFLAAIIALPRERLDDNSRLTYDIFRRQRELAIEGFTYPEELLPVNPFGGMQQQLARMAADSRKYPLESVKDYENWLLRIDDYVAWTQQAIANMREGMRRGYTSPRVLMQRMLPQLQGLGEDTSANVLYGPLRRIPDAIQEPDRTRLTDSLNRATRDKLLPAYRQLHDFIQNEYLPRARTTVGLSALPLGPSWYAFRVKRATGSPLTPREIHALGVAEVDRIRKLLQALAGGAPTADTNTHPEQSADAKAQTLAALPTLFTDIPQKDLEGAAEGEVPGVTTIARFLREEIPGRHYQISLQQARVDLPKFRRFGAEPAFIDGWALYAESLGEELGLYRDDEAKRNALIDQLTCAAALVVDTGLHANGWTRDQAVDYLRTQLAAADADAALLADRYAAMPADALTCMMGELKIRALRTRAQQAQGARFDIREFHSAILKDGAMPLDILEAKMSHWMEAGR
jgi:uncharacterized protein (DUF885 family)